MGSSKLTGFRKQRAMAQAGKSKLAPRMLALLYATSEPERITGPILGARRRGASIKVSAATGGCTVHELQYMLKLGEQGHGAYREFLDEWLRASAEPQVEVMQAAFEDATDLETRNPAKMKFALSLMDPEEHDPDLKAERARGAQAQQQTANFTVNINRDPKPPEDVTDAEFEEVDE